MDTMNIRIIKREYILGQLSYDIWVGGLPRAWDVPPAMLMAVVGCLLAGQLDGINV